jgi:hypothetical protein
MTRCWMRLFVLLVATSCAAGCAGYKIEKGGDGCGYDVYRPEPYVRMKPMSVAAADNKHLFYYDCEIIWLPNYNERYRVSSWAGLGKANFQATFSEGWRLTQIHDQSDNSEILKEIMGLVKHVLPADPFDIKSERAPSQGQAEFLNCQPIIYRIDFKDGRPNCLSQLNVQLLSCDKDGMPTPIGVQQPSCPKTPPRKDDADAAGKRSG